MESWSKYCPDYEMVEWNESNYDISKNRYMYEAYQNQKWGFVPDYARLDIIYEHGGIYLDTYVELVKPLDDLLYQPAFAGIDGSKLISLGLGFGAEKGNSFIRELRDAYDSMRFVLENGQLNMTPAPRVQQAIFKKYGYICNGDYQIINNMTVYPEKVLSGKCSYTGRIEVTNHTYSIHHYDGSWLTEEIRNVLRKRAQFFEMMEEI